MHLCVDLDASERVVIQDCVTPSYDDRHIASYRGGPFPDSVLAKAMAFSCVLLGLLAPFEVESPD